MKKIIALLLTLVFIGGALLTASFADGEFNSLTFGILCGIKANTATGYVSMPAGTTVDGLIGNLSDTTGISLERNGTVLDGSALLATGDTLTAGEHSFTAAVMGDVNGDGKVSVSDVTAVLKMIAAWDDVAGIAREYADVNGDTKANLSDVTLLLKVIAGWKGEKFASELVIPDPVKTGFAKTVKLTSGSETSPERYAENLCHGEQLGCKFTVTEAERATGATVVIPSWSNNIGEISLSVFTWMGSYDETLKFMPVRTEHLADVKDCSTVEFSFLDGAGQGLRPGDYLFLLHNGFEEKPASGGRGIGVWRNNLPTSGNFEFYYKNINPEKGINAPAAAYAYGFEGTLKFVDVK